jgi:hypothetical protein
MSSRSGHHLPAPDGGHEARTMIRAWLIAKLESHPGTPTTPTAAGLLAALKATNPGDTLPHGALYAASAWTGTWPLRAQGRLSEFATGRCRLTALWRERLTVAK